MTDTTPDTEWDLLVENAERLGQDNPESWQFSAYEVKLALTRLADVTTERDQAQQQLAFDWNQFAAPGGVDLVAAYQAWIDWYNADKQGEEDTHSHGLVREYVLSLITELQKARKALTDDDLRDRDTVPIVEYEEAVVKREEALAYARQKDQQIGDAPHGVGCASGTMANVDEFYPCSCWKAGL
ncbi:hypothetical protein [Frigoribacterium sp. RIT-PI-h]|uniref:hypothetical protein n=1 Tax=Frigoribacterium sp. RIT-PI-h TaxID=1690245 RepID=UPI000AE6F15A|nr:hypothetical protein [Frigoribacterium sp. RIT-PI-h]